MKNDNIDDKINNAPNIQAQKKKEDIENNLLKSSNENKSVDSKESNKQDNLRYDDNNNATNNNNAEHTTGQSANESNNVSTDSNNIGNNIEKGNSKNNSEQNNNASNLNNGNNNFNENCMRDNLDHSLDIAVLNEINKACQLSMNNISYLANMVNDKEMRKQLVAAYSQYSNIVLQVNQRFERYGEVPDEASIKLKLIGMSSIRAELMRNKSNSHIAEIMIQGTIMGIIKCQKIINAELEIDKETKDLLNTFKNFQVQNIQKLYEFL